jgi:hypothetical protein
MALLTGSLSNLYHFFNTKKNNEEEKEHSYLSKAIAKFVNYYITKLISFSNLLQTSNGRDKLCSLIQYIAKFYSACILYTIDIENKIDIEY